ncbi:MAG TPA: hypothetical protein VF720_12760 [Candidatus Eisenbacteria bacterium]
MIAALLVLLAVFDFQKSSAVDLFFTARARAAAAGYVPSGPKLQKAVDEVRRCEVELGGSAEWGIIEGALAGCETAADIKRTFGFFPEAYAYGDRSLKLRSATLKLATALEGAEKEFLADVWPKHLATLNTKEASLTKTLGPGEKIWLGHLVTYLDFEMPTKPALMYLVAEAPEPWGFTRLDRGSQPVIFLGVGNATGSTLAELAVHELIHALDARQGADRGALRELRIHLNEAGIATGSSESSRICHALMYIASGEVIKRIVSGQHHHFGETYGTYGRMPEVAPSLLEWWRRYLDGTIDREEMLASFVREYVAAKKP